MDQQNSQLDQGYPGGDLKALYGATLNRIDARTSIHQKELEATQLPTSV